MHRITQSCARTWLIFSIVISVLASVIAGMMVPLPGGEFRMGGQGGIRMPPEFRETIQEREALQSNIQILSPTNLYAETASDILGVAGGFLHGMGFQEF